MDTPLPRTYWDHDPADPLTCPACGWHGTTTGESFDALLDVRCPDCDGPLLKLTWPSTAETRAAAAAGNPRARAELATVVEREDRAAAAARAELREASQLPAIEGGPIVVVWDQVEANGERWTVLRHGDRELFRELCWWEGVDRFVEVATILQRAYGDRLRGVEPTPGSETWLYGDRLDAPRTVDGVNERLVSRPGAR